MIDTEMMDIAKNYAMAKANIMAHGLKLSRRKAALEAMKQEIIADAYANDQITGKNAQQRSAQEKALVENHPRIVELTAYLEDIEDEGVEVTREAAYHEAIYRLRLAQMRSA